MAKEYQLQQDVIVDAEQMFKLVSQLANDYLDRLNTLILRSGSREDINKVVRILNAPLRVEVIFKSKIVVDISCCDTYSLENEPGYIFQYGDFIRYAAVIQYLNENYAIIGSPILQFPPLWFNLAYQRSFRDIIIETIGATLEKLDTLSKNPDLEEQSYTILDRLFHQEPIKMQVRCSSVSHYFSSASYTIGYAIAQLIPCITIPRMQRLILYSICNRLKFRDVMEKYIRLMPSP